MRSIVYKKSHEPGLIPTSFLSSPSPTSTFTFSFNLHFQGPVPLSQPSFLSESRPGVACFVFSLRFKTTLSFLELSTTIFILTQTQQYQYKTPPKWFACLLPLSSLTLFLSTPSATLLVPRTSEMVTVVNLLAASACPARTVLRPAVPS